MKKFYSTSCGNIAKSLFPPELVFTPRVVVEIGNVEQKEVI
jgi:hypothetical protein